MTYAFERFADVQRKRRGITEGATGQEAANLRRQLAELQADRDSLAQTVARQAREIARMKGETAI